MGRWVLSAVLGATAACLFALPVLAQDPDTTSTTVADETTTSTAVAQEPPGLRGVLSSPDDEPVEGVTIIVGSEGGTVGEAVTGADGTWFVPLEEGGSYSVTLDVETLPDDLALRDPERATLPEIRVRPEQIRPVLFALVPTEGGEERGGPSRADRLLNLTVDGIRLGLIIAIASVGLSLIYGVTGLTNFAHGELVTFGALVAYLFSSSGVAQWPFVLAAVIAVALGGVFGLVQEVTLFAPLRRRRSGTVSLIVVTIGLSLLLRNVFLMIFAGLPRVYGEFNLQGPFDIGPFSLRAKDYVVMLIALGILALYGLALERTRLGTSVRAVANNADLAQASGIDVARTIRLTWIVGGALAATGGVLQGVSENVTYDMGFNLLLLMFAAVVLGGIGTAYGALAGGLVIGIASQVSTYWIDTKFRIGVGLAVLIIVVLVRPQGILGRRERIG